MTPWWVFSAVATPSRKPSWRRISAIRSLRIERGHSTSCLRARIPLRIRVRKSAIGSVIDTGRPSSPARLDHARDVAAERQLAETEATHLELAQIRAGPTTPQTAGLGPDLEFGLLGKPVD